MELAALVLIAGFCLIGMAWHEGAGRAQRRADAQAAREDRREARAQVATLERARLLVGHPLGPLGFLPPDARVSITTPPIRELPAPPPVVPIIPDIPALQLPGVMTLGQVVGYRPSRAAILLGLGPGGVLHTVSIEELLHLLIVGRTGGGKSVIERLIMTCLGAIPDVELHWWNPHYTPRDPDSGDEWDLIAARCVGGRALVHDAEILAALEQMATVDLPARKARYHAGAHPGPPRFYVIDEAPILAAADKRFMPWLGAVLREGRKFGLYIIMATQDALISTLGGSSGLRAQAQTVYYVGGDSYSAKALLGFVPPDPEGRGICHLKSTATPSAPLIRVPRPTNADVRAWLGPLVHVASAPSEAASRPFHVVPPSQIVEVAGEVIDAPAGSGTGKRQQVRVLVKAGVKSSAIIAEVWGVTGGRDYTKAAEELTTILAELVP